MANQQAGFWSSVADTYDRVADLQIGGKTRSMVRERVAREGNLGRVVEFGCGTGFYTEVLASKADTLLATDISPGMLEIATQKVNARHVTFRVEVSAHLLARRRLRHCLYRSGHPFHGPQPDCGRNVSDPAVWRHAYHRERRSAGTERPS